MNHRSRFKRTKIRANIKTIPIKGSGDDAGVWYECQFCGFTCNIDRDRLEGDNARAGNDTQIVITASSSGSSPPTKVDNGIDAYIGVLGGDLNFHHTTTKTGYDGEPEHVHHEFEPVVNFGCPFCGTTNWKGK